MTTRTLLQLSHAVMEKLALIDANASPSASDHQMISNRYTELMEGLREEGIGYWEDAAVPLLVFGAICDLVALHVGPAFGKPLVSVIQIEEAEIPIKRRIRKYTKKHASGLETVVVDY